jgi:IclR family pca regulon transcriptional regulator
MRVTLRQRATRFRHHQPAALTPCAAAVFALPCEKHGRLRGERGGSRAMTGNGTGVALGSREEGMGGLAKGLSIIEGFTRTRPQLSVTEAAVVSGTTPAAARRCLRTLESLGFVTFDGKYYRPTPRLMRLSNAYAEVDPLPVLAEQPLKTLREEFNESASLAVLDGQECIYVARVESSHSASTGMRAGTRVSAPITPAGRVQLAALPPAGLDAILDAFHPRPLTQYTMLTVAAIRARIDRVHEVGFDYSDQERELGIRAVAVPVVDGTGRTRAAMTMSTITARHTLEEMFDVFVPAIKIQAARLGAML